MLIYGLALMAAGMGALVTLRHELRPRRLRIPYAWHPRTWVVRTWLRSRPSHSGPRAVGRACPPPSCRLHGRVGADRSG